MPYSKKGGRTHAPALRLWGLVALLLLSSVLAPPRRLSAAAVGPYDPSGGRPAARVVVAQGGVQEISAATLAAAGLSVESAGALQLWRDGAPVALEQRGAGASLALRFFAPEPGDRWNAADTYWLTQEAAPGLRMAQRSVAPKSAPLSSAARERGHWREPATYDPERPGPVGDHWFSADLRTGPGLPAATLPITMAAALPLATGPMTLTVRGEAVSEGEHILDVMLGAATQQVRWSGAGAFTQTLNFAAGSDRAALALSPGAAPDQTLVADVLWERRAALGTAGGGAIFWGLAAPTRYQLGAAADGAALYDVSDPARPEVLVDVTASVFEDAGGGAYALATPASARRPLVQAYAGLALPSPGEAVYIAPAALQAALAPLLAHRRAAGRTVAVVDTQTIYDGWSFGKVDPEAIRAFLRYAAATWQPRPVAVTLVGDGTLDPHDYLGMANVNLVPPYLAPVDPWISETACEPCYGMLDGASPLDDDTQDLAVGRLPVKSAEDLARVVGRIVAYETERGGLGWRSRAVLVADNAREANGTPDVAGDFAAFADAAAAQLPAGVQAQKIYYDPWQGGAAASPWRVADARVARDRVRAALGAGAGLVVYAGHASHWEWAYTGPPLPAGERYLLGLYDPDTLGNGARLPIVLAMTCLTSGFHQPAFGGSVLDERLVLSEQGGALAVWGPTGLGVSYGHEALLRGFMAELRAKLGRATLGELTLAGYAALREDARSGNAGSLAALRTYALLGDPLTPARVLGVERAYLPLAQK